MKRTPPLLTPKTAARLAQLERELDLATPSFAETILAATLDTIKEGDHGIVLDGYEWEYGREWAESQLTALAESWRREDEAALEPAPEIDAAEISAYASQLATQDAQERAGRPAAVLTLPSRTNAQEGRK